MTDETPWKQYEARLTRVSAYLHDHLDEELDMAKLAEIACLSQWHWHRIYRAVHGETLAETVRRLRLNRAAHRLSTTTRPVAGIAAEAGYPSLASFSRVFKSSYGQSPAAYRKSGFHRVVTQALTNKDNTMFDVTYQTLQGFPVAAIRHHGSYLAISRAFDQLHMTLGTRGLHPQTGRMVGIYRDDPEAVAEADLVSWAGAEMVTPFDIDPPLERIDVAPGRFAVITHRGPYADLSRSYRWLYGVWLPQSGETVRDAPALEIYLNTPMNAAPADLLTELWLPIAG